MDLEINKSIQQYHPAAWRAFTDLGKRIYLPRGIPQQAQQAAQCEINATIGQCTDDLGKPMPLPVMAEKFQNLDPKDIFLYTSQGGRKDLRAAWREHILEDAPSNTNREDVDISLPVVSAGLTHGLSLVGELFVDSSTCVLLPNPRWDNYDLLFNVRVQGQIVDYDVMKIPENTTPQDIYPRRSSVFNSMGIVQKLREQAQKYKKILLSLNFPSNPSGYTPSQKELDILIVGIQDLVAEWKQTGSSHSLVILLDEAYKGMEWDKENSLTSSLFFQLQHLDKEFVVVCKVDGATKEMFFFGGRIGFISFASNLEARTALEEKVIGLMRSTISALSSPSQIVLLKALQSPLLIEQQISLRNILLERYEILQNVLQQSSLDYWPFNSAFFCLVHCPTDPQEKRLQLIERGLGVVSIPRTPALRISYSTVPKEKIPQLIEIFEGK
jgi:aspartate/methionine/tyrosine aminotransferase